MATWKVLNLRPLNFNPWIFVIKPTQLVINFVLPCADKLHWALIYSFFEIALTSHLVSNVQWMLLLSERDILPFLPSHIIDIFNKLSVIYPILTFFIQKGNAQKWNIWTMTTWKQLCSISKVYTVYFPDMFG